MPVLYSFDNEFRAVAYRNNPLDKLHVSRLSITCSCGIVYAWTKQCTTSCYIINCLYARAHKHAIPTRPSPNAYICCYTNQVFDDNFAKREINQFTVKCRTVKNGKECPWKGELGKIEVNSKFTKRHSICRKIVGFSFRM